MKLPGHRSTPIELLGATLLVALGLLLQYAVSVALEGYTGFEIALLVIAVIAGLFRLPIALAATGLMALGQAFFFIPPLRSFWIAEPRDAVHFALFVTVSLLVCTVVDRLRRSRVANDATLRELIKSNRARQVSEHRLDAGLNSMADPILLLHPLRDSTGRIEDFLIEYVNQPGAALGREGAAGPRQQQLGQRLSIVAPLHAQLGLVEAYARVVETGTPIDQEIAVPAPEASSVVTADAAGLMASHAEARGRDVQVRAHKLGDGVVVHWRDVSEHRSVQSSFRLSEGRYQSLVQAIGAIVWSTPPSGEFEPPLVEWSVFTGQQSAELKAWGWLNAIHPDDRVKTAQAWSEAIQGRRPYEVEHRLRRSDGEYRYMQARAVPILGADGTVREWLGVHTDITDRRRAEEIIADNERQLRRVLNALFTFVGVCTPDGTMVGANEAPLRAAGITADEVIGRKLWDCYWWSYAEPMQAQLREWIDAARRGDVIRQDVPIRVAGGKMMYIDFMLSPMRDESGEVTHLIPSGVDISDRKRAQAELADRERHYRQLIEGLPMLTWTATPDGECDYLNQRWAEYTGLPLESQLVHGWFDNVHPDDRGLLRAAWRGALESGEPMAVEYRLRRNDGAYRWFDSRAVPIRDDAGVVVRWFGTNLDIEDRRRAEQRFRRLYESNLVGIVFYDMRGALTDPNAAFLTIMGYDAARPPADLNWQKATPPEWADVDRLQWERLYEEGRCGPFEKEFFRPDGSRVSVMIAAADLDPGQHDFGVAFVIDMTHVKRVEEALRRTEASLRVVNESLEHRIRERTAELQLRSDQLRALALDLTETESRERKRLAQVLHDHFQQLVSAAKLKVGIIRRRMQDETLLETVTQVEDLLAETIDASRSLATELSPPVLHDAGLEAAFEWLARRMEKDHNLHVDVSVDPGCEPDNEQVRTILFECSRELLFNVRKHSGATEAQLTVSMPQEGLLQVCVTDQGKGFDPYAVEMKEKPDGSFGLFSIKERLGLLGGLVRVRSEHGQGTTVQITVPVTLKHARPFGGHLETIEASNGHLIEGVPNVRILVADDHRLFREGLISLISQEGFVEVIGQANDGQEAVDMARELKPDILICDVTMPKLNGVQVTAQLAKELPGLKIIGLSMHERDDMANAMRDAGAVAYCTKGGPTDTLLNVLRAVAASEASDDSTSSTPTPSNN